MERDRRFPKFESWLEKEYPSVYKEEFLHRSDLPIGVLLSVFGFYPWILSNLALGFFQIIGLVTSIFGILLLVRAYVLHRLQLRLYSYHGLSRKTLTEAIMFLDSKIVQPEELKSPAPYHGKFLDSALNIGMKDTSFANFMRVTSNLIVWPSNFINEFNKDLEEKKNRFRNRSIIFLMMLFISSSIAYYIFTSGGYTSMLIVFFPLIFCTLQGMYIFFRVLSDNSYLFQRNWISDSLVSESIQLEATMIEFLCRLQSDFQYPLRFHLGREYPHLVYTGRTKTTFSLVRLKEAVLYPLGSLSKEESTGAM